MTAEGWTRIGLGLGGNIGDVATTIADSLRQLESGGRVRISAVSSLYVTKPWGPVPQPDFVNACALAETDLAPHALLAAIKTIETALGRASSERWGPRAIDLDILFYGNAILDMPDLIIPHESLFERAFVLVPLAEMAPDLVIAGRRVGEAAGAMDTSGITRKT